MTTTQRASFRGVASRMTTAELTALRDGLAADDPALIQGLTVRPHRWQEVHITRPEAGCAIGYAVWKGGGLTTTGAVYDRDDELWFPERDEFVRYWDTTTRDVALPAVLAEVDKALKERETVGV